MRQHGADIVAASDWPKSVDGGFRWRNAIDGKTLALCIRFETLVLLGLTKTKDG